MFRYSVNNLIHCTYSSKKKSSSLNMMLKYLLPYQLLGKHFAKIHFRLNNLRFHGAGRCRVFAVESRYIPRKIDFIILRISANREIRSHALDKTSCGVNTEVSCSWMQPISRAPSLILGSGQGERVSKFYREEVRENRAKNERNGSIDL